MPREIEAKYRVETFEHVRRAVRAAGGEFLGRLLQTDTLFDRPDGALRASDQGLRLRRVRLLEGPGESEIDLRPLLTYKGARSETDASKSRREVQTHVDRPEVIEEILALGGLTPSFRLQKRRESYALGPCRIEMDELPMIGRFVEVEGPGEEQLADAARTLCLAGEAITESYFRLLAAECRRVNRECVEVTFENCPDCGQRET
ncbi:MAG: class IV adenylate cyclase [Planctomycetota bacterium]